MTIKIYDQILGLGLCQHTRQIFSKLWPIWDIPGLRKLAFGHMEIGIDYMEELVVKVSFMTKIFDFIWDFSSSLVFYKRFFCEKQAFLCRGLPPHEVALHE